MTSRVRVTAYGRAALEALREEVAAAKAQDPMAPVTVLAPSNVAGIVARRFLAGGLGSGPAGPGTGRPQGTAGPGSGRPSGTENPGTVRPQGTADPGTGRPQSTADPGPGRPQGTADLGTGHRGVAALTVTTLPRLAEQLASHTLHPRRPATSALLAAAWRTALAQDPRAFRDVVDHPATVRALVTAHHELRDLSDVALGHVGAATPLAGDVVALHRRVVAMLADAWYDATDLLHAAARLLAETPARATELGAAILYLPQQLTRAEAHLGRALAEHAELTVVAGLTGVRRADRPVIESLDLLGLAADEDPPPPPTATRVLHASDADDEVRCVVRELLDTLTTTPAHRVAVLYTAAQPYARLLHEHLAQAEVRVNGPATRAVHERAISRGVVGVLSLAGHDFSRAETFRALAEAPVRTHDGERVPVARWERVSRLAGVGKGTDWDERLTAYARLQDRTAAAEEAAEDPRPGRVERARRAATSARELRDFVARLRGTLELGAELTTWPELSSWALGLFHTLYGEPDGLTRLPPEEQYAATVVESSLSGLAVLGSVERTASLTRLVEVLDLALESALPRVGRYGEGVFVGPLSAAVGMDLDAVHVVGLAEDAYPGRAHEDALLGRPVREASRELRATRDDVDAKHRHLLAALAAAPTVVASFPRGDLRRSTERLPSRWLLPTLRELTGNRELAATEWADAAGGDAVVGSPSFAHSVATTDHPAGTHEWRVRAAAAGTPTHDDVAAAAHAMLAGRAGRDLTRYDGDLAGVDGLPDLAAGERRVSPTALESYASCPHAYFVQRLLRVEPLEEPEEVVTISPMEIGNLIHRSIDELVSEAAEEGTLPGFGEPWSARHRARLQEIGAAVAEDFAARGVTGHPRLWEQERPRLLADLAALLDQDDAWRAERDARVLRSELAFGRDGVAPVTIPLPDGGAVELTGSADKVDQLRDGTLVVTDIKTGKIDRFRALRADPVAAGTKLQLPVYAHAARQLLGGDSAEAGYWFVRTPGRERRIDLPLDAALEERFATTLQVLVRSIARGLFPARPAATPSYGYVDCRYCDPDGHGHGELRGRYEVKRHDPRLAELVGLIDPEALEDEA
ncbi:PD-(D/E)XK nuclease family protein [Georgenia sp. H159]|uniref:PD-(D/E)XK nuclease family protein n=1 Tax=Georgenia sp. H159 TaxID=3076115 RepID=UPI002D79E355|nr:PD-(D/E)XK nuclease family protein [Georgenia sp. H159]